MKTLNFSYGRAVLVLLTCIAGSIAIFEGASGNAFPIGQVDKQIIASSGSTSR